MELASKEQLRASFLRWAVVTVPAIVLLGLASGRIVPSGSENCWYQALAKPALNPPGWVFGVVWPLLYILLGLALAMIIHARGSRLRGPAIALFAMQLIVNLAWSPLFFGAHQVTGALVAILIILALSIATTVLFARIRRLAAWLMVPYLVWISFAGCLTFGIMQLNPHAESLVCGGTSTQITL